MCRIPLLLVLYLLFTYLLCLASCAFDVYCWSSNCPNRWYLVKAFYRCASNWWQWNGFHYVDAPNVSSFVDLAAIYCRPIVMQRSAPVNFRSYYHWDWQHYSVGADVAVVRQLLWLASEVFGWDWMCHRLSIAADSVRCYYFPPGYNFNIFLKFEWHWFE